jgi:putative ABC transport system substrate-binding protein
VTTRRDFLLATSAALLAPSATAVRAQAKAPVPRIGYLNIGSVGVNGVFLEAFRAGLRDLGYVDGKNIQIDVRWADGFAPALPQLASTLVKDRPEVIVTTCIPSTRAAKGATGTIPVVMSIDGDPVAAGLVASLGHPGANVTGTSTLFEQLIPKWLELLRAAAPKVREFAILRNPRNVIDPYFWGQFEAAAKSSGVKVTPFEASVPPDVDAAFADMARQRVGALVVMTEGFLASQSERLVPLADRYRLPAIYGYREFAEAGGMMSYGLSYRDYYRGVARYVDAVLKGAKPADLPVEQPTKIELVINLPTTRKLGLALPPELLARADRVIA